jgi:hypothetical protein
MNKRFFIPLALLFVFCTAVKSQKIDLDPVKTSTKLVILPKTFLPQEAKTYKFQLNGMHNVTNWGFIQENIVSKYGNLAGFTKVDDLQADLVWTVDMNPVQFNGSEVKSTSSTSKDKAGRETTTYTYWYEVSYFKLFSTKVVNSKGESLFSYSDGMEGQRYTHKGESKSTYKAAADALSNDLGQLKVNLAREAIDHALRSFKSYINNRFGYQQTNVVFNIYTTDSPKHPENEAFIKNVQECKRLFALIPATNLPDNVVADLEKVVTYFKGVAIKYTGTEKADIKLRYASHYNIAQIYQYLDQYDKSTEAANKLIANGFDEKDGRNFIKENLQLKEILTKGGQKSRRFERIKSKTETIEEVVEEPVTKNK